MTDPQPKRPRGRPRSATPLTATERDQRHRARHGLMSVRIPSDLADRLDRIVVAYGDPSRAAAIARAVHWLDVAERRGAGKALPTPR